MRDDTIENSDDYCGYLLYNNILISIIRRYITNVVEYQLTAGREKSDRLI